MTEQTDKPPQSDAQLMGLNLATLAHMLGGRPVLYFDAEAWRLEDPFAPPSLAVGVGFQSKDPATAYKPTVKAKREKTADDHAFAAWIANKDNGIAYIGGATYGWNRRGNFILLAAAHKGRHEQYSRKVGRQLVRQRLEQNQGILLTIDKNVNIRKVVTDFAHAFHQF